MRILLGTHHLTGYGGTETYVLTLAPALLERGHIVKCFAPFVGRSANELLEAGVPVVSEIDDLRRDVFDVAHVHHNVVAVQIRCALPDVPIAWLKHGTFPWLEQPPPFVPEVAMAVSDSTARQLRYECGLEVGVVPNPIDVDHFHPTNPISPTPRRAVAVSNHLLPHTRDLIWGACEALGISVRHVGQPDAVETDIRDVFENADVVFGVGRTALEAAAMGRAVVVLDHHGLDGWLDTDNYTALSRFGFSGRARGHTPDVLELTDFIRTGYDPTRAAETHRLIVENHGLETVVPLMESQYRRAMERGVIAHALPPPRLGLDLAGLFAAYQRELRSLTDRLAAAEQQVATGEAWVSEAQRAQEEATALADALEDVRHSTSWRVTGPLRAVSRLLRHLQLRS